MPDDEASHEGKRGEVLAVAGAVRQVRQVAAR